MYEGLHRGEISGVILAAGRGSRMQCMGRMLPKALLPIRNEPLIRRHFRQMEAAGIREVFVVIGHLGGMIRNYVREHPWPGLRITFVEQEEQAGIAHALARLEGQVRGPMLVYLGDIFYEVSGLREMLRRVGEGEVDSLLSVRREPDPELIRKNFSVELDGSGLVRRVVEKPATLINDMKGCGLYLLSGRVFEAIRRTPRSELRGEFEITDAIQLMIESGERIGVVENIGWDMNLTFDADLLECNLRGLGGSGKRNLIGEGAEIHREARIDRCVIGSGVKITCPVDLRDSLILPETVVAEEICGKEMILAPGRVIQLSID